MLKVATYNVNSIRARRELLLSWVSKEGPHILCLQELKVEDKDFPYEDFRSLGYQCYVNGQKTYNGVAICSKMPADGLLEKTGFEVLDRESRVITCKFGDVWVINVYFPHGDVRGTQKFYFKLEFYREFLNFLDHRFKPTDHIILLGDMNVAPQDMDVYDPQVLKDTIGTMPEERQALERLLNWGLVDSFRYLYPDKRQFTWWDYIGGMVWKDAGMRIDLILITQPLLGKLKDVYVDMWARKRRTPKPSDHAPVVALFEDLPIGQ